MLFNNKIMHKVEDYPQDTLLETVAVRLPQPPMPRVADSLKTFQKATDKHPMFMNGGLINPQQIFTADS